MLLTFGVVLVSVRIYKLSTIECIVTDCVIYTLQLLLTACVIRLLNT